MRFFPDNYPLTARWILAGPLAVIGAVLGMAAAPVWFPAGAGGIDHIAFPLVLFPAFWAAIVFYVLLEDRLNRAALIVTAVLVINAGIALPPVFKLMNSVQTEQNAEQEQSESNSMSTEKSDV